MNAVEDTRRDEIYADFENVQNLLLDQGVYTMSREGQAAVSSSKVLLLQSCSFAVNDVFERLLSNLYKINKLVSAVAIQGIRKKDWSNKLVYDCLEIAHEKKHDEVVRLVLEFAASELGYYMSRLDALYNQFVSLTLLQSAAFKGDFEITTTLIKSGVDVNQTNRVGETALHFAKNSAIASVLISNGADVNAMNKKNETPLFYAVASYRIGVIRTLLNNGAKPDLGSSFIPEDVACEWDNDRSIARALLQTFSPNKRDTRMTASCVWFNVKGHRNHNWLRDTRKPYCESCKDENHLLIEEIRAMEVLNDTNTQEFSALHSAIMNTHHVNNDNDTNLTNIDQLKHLLSTSESAIVNALDGDGTTALYLAVERNLIDVATLLLNSGANPNMTNSGKYPLIVACRFSSHEIVELLLTRGADSNVIDNYENTPLFIAVRNLDFRLVKLLVEHGADVNHRDKEEGTALELLTFEPRTHECQYSGSAIIRIAEFLVENGFKVQSTTINGVAALYRIILNAASDCNGINYRLFELVMKHEPDIRCFIGEDRTLTHLPFVVREYLRHGGDPNCSDINGRNLIDIAFNRFSEHSARILLAAGADSSLVTWDSIVSVSKRGKISLLDTMLASGVKLIPNIDKDVSLCRCEPPEVITLREFYVPLCTKTENIVRLFKSGSSLDLLAICCRARPRYDAGINCSSAGRLCQAVVLAGHKVQQQQLIELLKESEQPHNRDLVSWLEEESMTPPSLLRLSRTVIRRKLSAASGYRTILPLIDVLPISNAMRMYLKFEGLFSEINLSPRSEIYGVDGESKTPSSLLRLSRTFIRRHLSAASGYQTILPLIDVLPISNAMRMYLKFEGTYKEIDFSYGSDECRVCRRNLASWEWG